MCKKAKIGIKIKLKQAENELKAQNAKCSSKRPRRLLKGQKCGIWPEKGQLGKTDKMSCITTRIHKQYNKHSMDSGDITKRIHDSTNSRHKKDVKIITFLSTTVVSSVESSLGSCGSYASDDTGSMFAFVNIYL